MNLLTKGVIYRLRKEDVEQIIVHCSATPPNRDIGFKDIDLWHRRKGWLMCGYHKIIKRDGTVEDGRPLHRSGAHARGYNHKSWGVCLVGGVDENLHPENNFTEIQMTRLKEVISHLIGLTNHDLKVIGHNEVSNKACPSFDVQVWLHAENNNNNEGE
jgi:N-acetylmuramoyl-L-alanine amidase